MSSWGWKGQWKKPSQDDGEKTPSGQPIPIVINGQVIGYNVGGEFFTPQEIQSLGTTGAFPVTPAPVSGPSYEQVLQAFYNMRRDYWDQQIIAQGIPRQEAREQFEADMSEFTARLQAQTEQRLAETANQTAAINVEDIATQRGRSWAQDILPVALPGMTQLRVPGLEQVFPGGNMPLPQVPANPAAYYGQFRPTVPQVAMPGLGATVPPAPRLTPTQVPPVPMPGI